MEAIKIKNSWNGKVLYSGEHADIKEAVEAAVKAGADLRDAYLGGAYLRSEERRVGKECRSRWSPYH